ncbi:hypothetical protein RclHR1_04450006 [Rhizophagus clarus]|uniref:Kinase-like domain-containing protein n=1 Tax=Rhizophagus clarus TaxID=94130 RepID=A0A2Z6RH68_9GLOM|nr:hypothetical protein RclHR1_04450006 [Rhizophagus clarus]GES80882.1 kinase-like domain-containing protein [Rhizophagus clarus]
MDVNNQTQVPLESELNKLNISDKNSNLLSNHKDCYKPECKKLWCNECVPSCIIEGWTSENHDVDKFIKSTIYNARYCYNNDYSSNNRYNVNDDSDSHSDTFDYFGCPIFLEWVPFNKFENIKQTGEGGFSKVYSALWIDGKAQY